MPPPTAAWNSEDPSFALTLARGLQLLQCFTAEEPVLGNTEIARRTGFSKPTVSRFTYTLVQLGYLREDGRSGKYRVGTAALKLVHPVLEPLSFRHVVRPLMDELANKMRGSVSIGVRDRLDIVYVETSRRHSRSRSGGMLSADVGLSHPIAATAIGHAWLAGAPPREREATLNEIRVKSPSIWMEHEADIARSLKQLSAVGYCSMRKDPYPGHFAVGVPLGINAEGDTIVINLSVASSAVVGAADERKAAEALKLVAEKMRVTLVGIE